MNTFLEQLDAERLRNMNSHNCSITHDDYKRIMPKIELLQRLAETERSLYAVFDMNKQNYLLESQEQKRIFGKKNRIAGGKYDAEILYKNIHPDDLSFVLETDNMIYQFYSELPASEKKDYKLVYEFRVKDTEGVYRSYMHQSIILEQDRNGKAWLSLIISDLLPDSGAGFALRRRLINMKTGKLHLFNDDEINSASLLTRRESEILYMIARGYNSKSISEKLFISINTVNNHRQNILRKTNTENTTQAVFYCKRLGII